MKRKGLAGLVLGAFLAGVAPGCVAEVDRLHEPGRQNGLLYVSDFDEEQKSQLYAVDPENSAQRVQLTEGDQGHFDPEVSRDGRKIVFRTGDYKTHKAKVDGVNLDDIREVHSGDLITLDPTFDNYGNIVVAARLPATTVDEHTQVYSLSNGTPTRMTYTAGDKRDTTTCGNDTVYTHHEFNGTNIVSTRDGRYTSSDYTEENTQPSCFDGTVYFTHRNMDDDNSRIRSLDTYTGKVTDLTDSQEGSCTNPKISPDGTKLAMACYDNNFMPDGINIMDLETGNTTYVGTGIDFSWGSSD